ncbi:MAG: hypothetical protein WC314_11730 [Vulcanimicrobiota bacterium]
MSASTRHGGFSLAELIISIGFFGLAILTLLGLSISISRTDSKALERSAGTLIANQVLGQTLAQLQADNPAGIRERFFAEENVSPPWQEGSLTNDRTTFYYQVQVASVSRASGGSMGTALYSSRLKKVVVHVWWAGEEEQTRQGSGQLEVYVTRLVSESEIPLVPH